jgi:hypothetical protein
MGKLSLSLLLNREKNEEKWSYGTKEVVKINSKDQINWELVNSPINVV